MTRLLKGIYKQVVNGHYTHPKCDLRVPMEGGDVRVVKGIDENIADEIVRAVSVYVDLDKVIRDAVDVQLSAHAQGRAEGEAVIVAAQKTLTYWQRNGLRNFQFEKMDDYMRMIEQALAAVDAAAQDAPANIQGEMK